MTEHFRDAEDARLKEAGTWLLQLRSPDLTDEEMNRWIVWCESDPENLRCFDQLQTLWNAVGDAAPSRNYAQPLALTRSRIHMFSWGALAATVVIFGLLGALSFLGSFWRTSARLASVARVDTAISQNRQALLADGSELIVAAHSSVAVHYTDRTRRLKLQSGEAFFRVKADPNRPFVVQVEGVDVVALGTAFNIRRDADEVAVTVTEGRVEVRRAADGAVRRAGVGEQIFMSSRPGPLRLARVEPAVALAWQAGRLEFSGDSLKAVLGTVNRYTDRPIRIVSPDIENLRFTGTIFLDSIDAWVDALPQIYPVSVHDENRREIAARSSIAAEPIEPVSPNEP